MKSELIEKIILSLSDVVGINIGDLKSRLYMAMNGYSIGRENTQIVVREEDKNEWYFKKFIMTKTVQGLSEKTLAQYSAEIPRILSMIGKPAECVSSDDILYYLALREHRDKVSKVTVSNNLRYLRTFFEFLTIEGIIPTNPARKVGSIKVAKKQKKAFTDVEVLKLRQGCENVKEKLIVDMLLSTGCRVSELVSIKFEDIDGRKINVLGKGNKERTVYLNAQARLTLDEHIQEINLVNNPYVFPSTRYRNSKDHTSNSAIEGFCKRLGEKAGVRNVHPHRFRRTCATMALKRGMPVEQVSKMLGHEDLKTTQIYLDLDERNLEIAHEKYVV
nr:MAG TPA: SITE SPECIFIC RECOMBINASE XERD [Caudoviricetes sp.]